MGHVWDEDLEEYNNPLPRWWMWLFYITIVFALVYLVLYPGLGSFAGRAEVDLARASTTPSMAQAKDKYEPIYAKYAAMAIPDVAADPQAREIGPAPVPQLLRAVPCFRCARRQAASPT